MSIILDNREHGLIELMPDVTVQQLSVGDAHILSEEKPILVIERKTTADFVASFMDGRYREQRTRLLAFCAEHKAKAMYILEGGVDGPCRGLEKPAIQKLMNRLMLRYGIPVWITRSLEETANAISILSLQVLDDKTVFDGTQLSYTDVMATTKKANLAEPKTFLIGALTGCPGVSAKAAGAIVEVFKSLDELLKADVKALAEVKVGARRLGPAVAGRLLQLLRGSA
jgi:ERCC4-type nuclease